MPKMPMSPANPKRSNANQMGTVGSRTKGPDRKGKVESNSGTPVRPTSRASGSMPGKKPTFRS